MAVVSAPATASVFGRFEIELRGPAHGNPFVDVALSAIVDGPDGSVRVPVALRPFLGGREVLEPVAKA